MSALSDFLSGKRPKLKKDTLEAPDPPTFPYGTIKWGAVGDGGVVSTKDLTLGIPTKSADHVVDALGGFDIGTSDSISSTGSILSDMRRGRPMSSEHLRSQLYDILSVLGEIINDSHPKKEIVEAALKQLSHWGFEFHYLIKPDSDPFSLDTHFTLVPHSVYSTMLLTLYSMLNDPNSSVGL